MPLTSYIMIIHQRPKCSLNLLQDQGWDIPELKEHSLKSKTDSILCFVSPSFHSLSLIPLNQEHMSPPPHPAWNKTFSACIHYILLFIWLLVHSFSVPSDHFMAPSDMFSFDAKLERERIRRHHDLNQTDFVYTVFDIFNCLLPNLHQAAQFLRIPQETKLSFQLCCTVFKMNFVSLKIP